jgi:hypothetical protein
MSDAPNPGSGEAVELGCTCPVIDNHYGEGVPMWPFPWQEGHSWWINADCPLHAHED